MKYTPQQWIAFADWDDGLPGSVDPKGALSGVKVSDIYRAHAAALERIAKLEKHAEAMEDAIYAMSHDAVQYGAGDAFTAADFYRADFPKEPR